MAHLIISFLTAAIAGLAIYVETSSFGLAFLAYTGAGTMTLLLVLLATALSTAQDAEVSLA